MRINTSKYSFLAFLILLALPFLSLSQNSGFMGKKNIISINTTGGARIIPLLSPDGADNRYYTKFNESNGKYEDKWNLLKWSVGASYKRLIKRNVAVGMEFRYSSLQITNGYTPYDLNRYINLDGSFTTDNWNYPYYPGQNNAISSPKFHVFNLKPTITMAQNNSLYPMGLSHTIGFGPTLHVLNTSKPMSYKVFSENSAGDYIQSNEIIEKPADGFSNMLWGIEFLYSTTINYPISKFMMIEFGYDMRFGFAFPNNSSRADNNSYFNSTDFETLNSQLYYNADYHRPLLLENLTSILSFRLGLVFVL